jgi:putative ABC transport system ATP-binding protein
VNSSIIEAKNITKEYQLGKTTVSALRGIDLVIEKGEFTAIMGPSGSGKSTLLNIIGCLDRPSGGDLLVDGESIGARDFDDLAEIRNTKIGFVFQAFNLIPVINVFENIEFPCVVGPRQESRKAIRERIEKIAEQVGLTKQLHHRPAELSGGQQQRVAIARALVTQPKLVLADEPTANLDSQTSQAIINLMLDLNKQQNVTFLFSTHDPRIVSHARRVVHIADGKLLEGEFKGVAGGAASHGA